MKRIVQKRGRFTVKFLIQRVRSASVSVDSQVLGEIQKGFCVLIGVSETDTEAIADKMVKKMLGLRIFEDSDGKTNLSLEQVQGQLLLISQFTLYADCKKGNRPSFIHAGAPDKANLLYEYVIRLCREAGYPVQTGRFGADMQVQLCNDGPFTIMLNSAEL
jgi:D-tyrosyl-tRNA(Tyr) deacylase